MKKKKQEFKIEYHLDAGHRPHFVSVRSHEIDEDATEEELRRFLEEVVTTHMMDTITPMVKNTGDFIAWAKERTKNEDE